MPRCSPSPNAQVMTMGSSRWPISRAHHSHNHLQVDGRRLVESDRPEHRAAEGKRLRAVLRPIEARRGFLSTAAAEYGPIERGETSKNAFNFGCSLPAGTPTGAWRSMRVMAVLGREGRLPKPFLGPASSLAFQRFPQTSQAARSGYQQPPMGRQAAARLSIF